MPAGLIIVGNKRTSVRIHCRKKNLKSINKQVTADYHSAAVVTWFLNRQKSGLPALTSAQKCYVTMQNTNRKMIRGQNGVC